MILAAGIASVPEHSLLKLLPNTMAHDNDKKQKINLFNVLILIFVGLGSMTYGYSAAVIGITLGMSSSSVGS